MTIQEQAVIYHASGYSCAQAVFAACAVRVMGFDEKTALAVSGGLGGGVRCGEICGAVTGAVMALGLAYPFDDNTDMDAKKRITDITCRLTNAFREKYGAVRCTELLGTDTTTPELLLAAKEAGKTVICNDFIAFAAETAERLMRERETRS